MKPWLLRLRNIVEGSHTPSMEERWRTRSQKPYPYAGQKCPCGEPATSIYQIQIQGDSASYYTCSEHRGITRWIPDPDDPGTWF